MNSWKVGRGMPVNSWKVGRIVMSCHSILHALLTTLATTLATGAMVTFST